MPEGHPLAHILDDAARGRYPKADGVCEVLPPIEGGRADAGAPATKEEVARALIEAEHARVFGGADAAAAVERLVRLADRESEHADVVRVVAELRVAELALSRRIPAMFGRPEFVAAGGLMSYGTPPAEMTRRAAAYVDKILKGAKPADLPIEQPTRFDLVINLKTAQALGLTIPRSVLDQASELIQ